MTKEQVIELAKQAGIVIPTRFSHDRTVAELERFATLVRNAALEEAAQACKLALDAHAIRNLKEPTP
ncbi:hypothetical protein MCEMIEM13_01487 [Comamonadaceae bacterium]